MKFILSNSTVRFVKYFGVGFSTLMLDLGMLYVAVSIWKVPYYIATPVAFLIAISCNYAISRRFVFEGTERSWSGGYVNFAAVALAGATLTTTLVAVLVSFFGLQYLLARVAVAGMVGIGNYLFNLYINFKVVGKHHSS